MLGSLFHSSSEPLLFNRYPSQDIILDPAPQLVSFIRLWKRSSVRDQMAPFLSGDIFNFPHHNALDLA